MATQLAASVRLGVEPDQACLPECPSWNRTLQCPFRLFLHRTGIPLQHAVIVPPLASVPRRLHPRNMAVSALLPSLQILEAEVDVSQWRRRRCPPR